MSQGHVPPPPPPADFSAYPEPKRGMGTGMKVFLALVALFGVMFLLCCGGMTFMGYKGAAMMANAVSRDPAVIQRVSGEIAEMSIPDSYQPKLSIDMRVPVTDQILWRCALYTMQPADGIFLLGQVSPEMAGGKPEQVYEHLQELISQMANDDSSPDDLEIASTEEREFMIRGEKATFDIGRGTGQESKKEFVRVVGAFPGQSNPAILVLFTEASQYDEAAFADMLGSIK